MSEWQPTKAEYLRLEREVVNLIAKAHEQGRAIGLMVLLWIVTMILVGFKVLLG